MMGSSKRDELVDRAIQKVLTEIDKIDQLEFSGDDDDENRHDQRQLLLSSLLSELESLKSDGMHAQPGALMKPEKEEEGEVNSCRELGEVESEGNGKPGGGEVGGGCKTSNETVGVEEMVKEIRVVKRQNLVTHCLLSAMILVTVTWQLSEVSLILKVKDGLIHPFRSLGSMLFGRGNGSPHHQEAEKQQSCNVPNGRDE